MTRTPTGIKINKVRPLIRILQHQTVHDLNIEFNHHQFVYCCIAPMVWAFLSTTVQLHVTHRKVEGGGRDTQLVHVNEANSCLARGHCMSQAAQGERRLSSPPPPSFLSHSPPPSPAEFMWFSASSAESEDGLYLGAQKCCSWIQTAFVIMYEFELKW